MGTKPTRKKLGISTKPKATAEVKAPAGPVEEDNLSSPTAGQLNDETPSARAVMEKVEEWFKGIGTELLPETIMPVPSNRNNGPEASEFAIAEKLFKLAEKRKKEAFEAAKKAGVFGDEEDYITGDTVMVWQSPYLTVSVKKGNPSRMIGKDETEAALEAALPKGKAAEVLEACMKDRAATTQFIVAIK